MDLEDSINLYHEKHNDPILNTLRTDRIRPTPGTDGVYQLKRYAREGLGPKFKEQGFVFEESVLKFQDALDNGIRGIPLKQVGYGILQMGIPPDIAKQLTPWDAVYLYAGIWAVRSSDYKKATFIPRAEKQTLYQNLRELIEFGMDRIKYIHNEEHKKYIQNKNPEKIGYKNPIDTVPQRAEVMKRWLKPKITSLAQLMKTNPNQRKMELGE